MPNTVSLVGLWLLVASVFCQTQNFREHAGEAPPYPVRQQDLQVFVLNDKSAVAAFVKVYVAKENKNIAHEELSKMINFDISNKVTGS